jgi:hypothetical protein
MASSAPLHVYDDYSLAHEEPAGPGGAAHAADPAAPRAGDPAAAAWLAQVCRCAERGRNQHEQGPTSLFALIRGSGPRASDRTAAVLNRASAVIGAAFPWTSADAGAARAALYLYERALHAMLLASLRGGGAAPRPGAERDALVSLVTDAAAWQEGIAHAALEAVAYARGGAPREAFPALLERLDRRGRAVELWRGLRFLARCLGPAAADGVARMPPGLAAYLARAEERLLEEYVFLPGSSAFALLAAAASARRGAAGAAAREADAVALSNGAALLRAVGALARRRAAALCAAVARAALPPEEAAAAAAPYGAATAALLDALLAAALDALFNQHLTAVVAAAAFYAGRALGLPGVSFKALAAAAGAALPGHDPDALRAVALQPLRSLSAGGGADSDEDEWEFSPAAGGSRSPPAPAPLGAMRQLYNAVLLPAFDKLGAELPEEELFGPGGAELRAALRGAVPEENASAAARAGAKRAAPRAAGARRPLSSLDSSVSLVGWRRAGGSRLAEKVRV